MRAAGVALRRWGVVQLEALDADTLAEIAVSLRAARLLTLRYSNFGNWHERAADWPSYLAARPGPLRETIRRRLRAVADGRLRPDFTHSDSALSAYEEVHRSSWKLPEPFPAFAPRFLRDAAEAGILRMSVLQHENRPVAAQYWTVENGTATVLKLAHDESLKRLSPGTVLTALTVQRLFEQDGVTEIDFGRGDDAYKQLWAGARRQRMGALIINPFTRLACARPSGTRPGALSGRSPRSGDPCNNRTQAAGVGRGHVSCYRAAGFIGSHLVDSLLAAGHSVRGLDDLSTGRMENLDKRCTLVRGDVAQPGIVGTAMHGVDGCFHLAAVASVQRGNEDWVGTHRVNQTGTVRRSGCRPCNRPRAGGLRVFRRGLRHRRGYCDRGSTAPAAHCLRADKLGSELHARVGALVHSVPSTGLRFFNVYGPRQDPLSPYSGVISIFARRIAEDAGITVHGDGAQTRDFVFVADVVRHLRAAMDMLSVSGSAQAYVYNVCTGRETSIAGLAHTLGEVSGRAARITHGPARAGDIARSVGSPERAVAGLGVRAEVELRDGLRMLLSSS